MALAHILSTVKAFFLAGLKFGGFEIESYLAGI